MRYFTVAEANAHLSRLNALASRLREVHDSIVKLRPSIIPVLEKGDANSGSPTASQMYLLFLRFEALLRRINAMGIEVKDPGSGLCDFPALYQGRDIYLCWRLGEAQVEWWHELHTGYAGRRHVNELL